MKKFFIIILMIVLSGVLSNIFFYFNIYVNFSLMVTYWITAGFIYFKKTNKMGYLPFIILSIYTISNMFMQVRFAKLEMIITLHKLTVWTNFGFIPLFKVFYMPEHSMDVYAYFIFGIVYFIIINILFYLGYLFNSLFKEKEMRAFPLLSRLGARIIDGIIFGLLTIIFGGIYESIWTVIIFLLYPIYYIIMHIYYGQTIGKKIFGIKLISVKKGALNPLMISIREIIVFITMYSSFIINHIFSAYNKIIILTTNINITITFITLVIMLSNKYHRTFHDFLTGTAVIRTSKGISKLLNFN